MSIVRKIIPAIKTVGAIGKKVLNTGVGKVITKLGTSAAEGAISGVAQDVVIKALNKPVESVESFAPGCIASPAETVETTSGSGIPLKINKDDYEKMLEIYECLQKKKI